MRITMGEKGNQIVNIGLATAAAAASIDGSSKKVKWVLTIKVAPLYNLDCLQQFVHSLLFGSH
jgi:hypothetical protein